LLLLLFPTPYVSLDFSVVDETLDHFNTFSGVYFYPLFLSRGFAGGAALTVGLVGAGGDESVKMLRSIIFSLASQRLTDGLVGGGMSTGFNLSMSSMLLFLTRRGRESCRWSKDNEQW